MFPKPRALPRPPAAVVPDLTKWSETEIEAFLTELLRQRKAEAYNLGVLDKRIEFVLAYICGKTDDTQHVEDYDGTLGVSQAFVARHERAVGQLQWMDDLQAEFDSPGDIVDNERWGSGALLKDNLFLSAGHCFDGEGLNRELPSNGGVQISPAEAAAAMHVNFNYQKVKNKSAIRQGISFPIVDLIEFRLGKLDYAILELGDNNGTMPNDAFDWLDVAAMDLTTIGAILCIIQHPNGDPKKIEAGPMVNNSLGVISYNDIDVGGGASGAPILHPIGDGDRGEIVGVHNYGGCSAYNGSNSGVAVGAIRKVSAIL